MVKRIAQYLIGITCISIGVNVAKLAQIGITPGTSVPRLLEVLSPLTLGQCIMIVYACLILLQILLLRKKFPIKNLLGLPMTLLYGQITDLVGIDPQALGHLMSRVPAPTGYGMKLVFIAVAILVIGTGTFLYTAADIVPLPPEGLAGAIHTLTKKNFGDCKSFVDVGMVSTAAILQMIFLGGVRSFLRPDVVVREGTFLTAVLIGQVVKLWHKACRGRKSG